MLPNVDPPTPRPGAEPLAPGPAGLVAALQALVILLSAVPALALRMVTRTPYSGDDHLTVSAHVPLAYHRSADHPAEPGLTSTPAEDVAGLAAGLGAEVFPEWSAAAAAAGPAGPDGPPGWFAERRDRFVARCIWPGSPGLDLELHAVRDLAPWPRDLVPVADPDVWAVTGRALTTQHLPQLLRIAFGTPEPAPVAERLPYVERAQLPLIGWTAPHDGVAHGPLLDPLQVELTDGPLRGLVVTMAAPGRALAVGTAGHYVPDDDGTYEWAAELPTEAAVIWTGHDPVAYTAQESPAAAEDVDAAAATTVLPAVKRPAVDQ